MAFYSKILPWKTISSIEPMSSEQKDMKILFYLSIILAIFIFVACTRSIPTEPETVTFPGLEASSPDALSTEQTDDMGQPIQISTPKLERTITLDQITPSVYAIAKVAEIGFVGDELLIITVKIHDMLDFEITALLNNIEYTCISQEDIPDYVYCYGPKPETELSAEFLLKCVEDETLILAEEIMIPFQDKDQTPASTDS
jgi:hypothetical protein